MTIQGTVTDLKGSRATVEYCDKADCGTCSSCTHLFKQRRTTVEVSNPKELPLNPGDVVEIFLSPSRAIKAGFDVLILPILLFFPLYLVGRDLLEIESEIVNVLLGTIGILLGFSINLYYKKTKGEADLPEISRVLLPFRNSLN
jgi:positive regulator of sigma E activity